MRCTFSLIGVTAQTNSPFKTDYVWLCASESKQKGGGNTKCHLDLSTFLGNSEA